MDRGSHHLRGLCSPGKAAFFLGLRFAALIILLLISAQPVRSFESREIEREAILVDESDSMLLADQRLNAGTPDRAALSDLPELLSDPLREISNLVESIDRNRRRSPRL